MHPAPWRHLSAVAPAASPPAPDDHHTLGDANIGDFDQYLADPDFAQAWGQVQNQLTAEGSTAIGVINNAKSTFLSAYTQLGTAASYLQSGQLAEAAKQFTMAGQTVAGAVNMVTGLVNAQKGGITPQAGLAITQTFIGTMIGVGVAAGSVSAGVGAAIVAAITGLIALLQAAGLFNDQPLSGQQICGTVFNPPPSFAVGCIAVYPNDPNNPANDPGAIAWRKFPDPNNAADAAWFSLDQGVEIGQWQGARWNNPPVALGSAVGVRPIDSAFDVYRQFECEIARRPDDEFLAAFFSAWKANKEYALNGLKAQPDWQVLLHLIRVWNFAHQGPVGIWPPLPLAPVRANIRYDAVATPPGAVAPPPAQGTLDACPTKIAPYVNMLASDVLGHIAPNDPIVVQAPMGLGRSLGINQGPIKQAPQTIGLHTGHGGSAGALGVWQKLSTPQKVAAAAAGGAASVGVYAWITNQTYAHAFGALYAATVGRVLAWSAPRVRDAEQEVSAIARRLHAGEASMRVQSLLFPRPAWTPSEARRWATAHGYRAGKADVTANYVRLRQADPRSFRVLRTVPFGRGIRAVVGRR